MRNYNQQIVIKIGKFAHEILEIITNINLFTRYVYSYKNSSICSKHMKNYCQYKREIVLFAHVSNLRFIDHASNYSRLKITWQKGKKWMKYTGRNGFRGIETKWRRRETSQGARSISRHPGPRVKSMPVGVAEGWSPYCGRWNHGWTWKRFDYVSVIAYIMP